MAQPITHHCQVPVRGRDGFWRSCRRAAHFVTVPVPNGYVELKRVEVGAYCARHARAAVAGRNAERRSVLRWEHGELLHRQAVAGCPSCGPI